MSHEGEENQGTGLRDVYDLLVKAPQERLLSLTFQLGESPEDNIIHALCLIILQREAEALNKLQALRDNYLARHLAEKWQMSGDKSEDFGIHCGNFQEFTKESLAALARIFKVLSQQRLCDPLLRDLAYKRALSSDGQKTSNCIDLEYDQLTEEAKDICGPQFVEWMCSPTDLKSVSLRDLYNSLDEGNTTLKVTLNQDQPHRAHSLPSPLQVSSSMPSYPSHLEISIPPTALFQDDKTTQERPDESKLNTPVLPVSECEAKNAPGQSQTSEEPQLKSNEPKKLPRTDETFPAENIKLDSLTSPTKTQKPTTETNLVRPTATSIVLPMMPASNESPEEEDEEEEEKEEAQFYAFVIFHAPEDADMAESMRITLESVIGCEGATFSEDFAIPGRSTLRCVEDAINNTAFTLLLLTCNFSTRMQNIETDAALINSINKTHKYNTVIPLLPRKNRMPRQSMPTVLQTLVPLDESRSFEKKIKASLSPARIRKQKRIWSEEQTVKKQRERQERLKQLCQHQKQLIKECKAARLLEKENFRLMKQQQQLLCPNVPPEQDGGDGRAQQQNQQPRNIHIEHAQYIMIGNESRMTVGLGGGEDKDDLDEQ
uniref:TIR domain-containing adaptor inducing IFN-Beta n=1 Tax=Larimichthys crocea TaxID=215358 RepID=A0A4D6JFP7_LARCR|nr:TIR domain-containing adaptor inducing IFN-Beta [Larimichthys crocea]